MHTPEEHEDRAGQSLATRSHEVIQHWAEERRAQAATVEGTAHASRPGVLRFNFPGFGQGGRLNEIDWQDWFRSFDARELCSCSRSTSATASRATSSASAARTGSARRVDAGGFERPVEPRRARKKANVS